MASTRLQQTELERLCMDSHCKDLEERAPNYPVICCQSGPSSLTPSEPFTSVLPPDYVVPCVRDELNFSIDDVENNEEITVERVDRYFLYIDVLNIYNFPSETYLPCFLVFLT